MPTPRHRPAAARHHSGTRRWVRGTVALLACLLSSAACSESEAPLPITGGRQAVEVDTPADSPERVARLSDLLDVLRSHRATLWVRVPQTAPGGIDESVWPAVRQRALTEQGRDQARALGEALRARAIPVGEVSICPHARCIDAAELAFARGTVTPELDNILANTLMRDRAFAWTKDRLQNPQSGQVLLGHAATMLALTGVTVAEGGALVVVPDPDTGFAVMGTVAPGDWALLAAASTDTP